MTHTVLRNLQFSKLKQQEKGLIHIFENSKKQTRICSSHRNSKAVPSPVKKSMQAGKQDKNHIFMQSVLSYIKILFLDFDAVWSMPIYIITVEHQPTEKSDK